MTTPHQADRRNKIPSSPKNLASEILYSAAEAPRYCNCALPLDVSHHVRYRIFRQNADAHVHVIRHNVPFYNFRFLLRRKFIEYLAQMLSQHSKYPLPTLLRNEYHRALTIPSWILNDRRIGQPPAKPGASSLSYSCQMPIISTVTLIPTV